LRGEGTTDAGDAGSGDGDARGASQPGTVRERGDGSQRKGSGIVGESAVLVVDGGMGLPDGQGCASIKMASGS